MNTRSARVLRGLSAASVAVFVAALSHAAGGGGAPGTVGLVLALAFSALVCTALAGRTLSLVRLSVSVIISQVILHTLFTVGAPSGDGGAVTMSTMDHHGAVVVSIAGPAASAAGPAAAIDPAASLLAVVAAQLCSGMWIAHLVAALVTILALRRGESAFWGLLLLAGLRFRRLVRALFVEPRPVLRPDRSTVVRVPDRLRDLGVFLGGLRHRGPPVCVRFAH